MPDFSTNRTDIVNTAGVSLVYRFGKKKILFQAPVAYTTIDGSTLPAAVVAGTHRDSSKHLTTPRPQIIDTVAPVRKPSGEVALKNVHSRVDSLAESISQLGEATSTDTIVMSYTSAAAIQQAADDLKASQEQLQANIEMSQRRGEITLYEMERLREQSSRLQSQIEAYRAAAGTGAMKADVAEKEMRRMQREMSLLQLEYERKLRSAALAPSMQFVIDSMQRRQGETEMQLKLDMILRELNHLKRLQDLGNQPGREVYRSSVDSLQKLVNKLQLRYDTLAVRLLDSQTFSIEDSVGRVAEFFAVTFGVNQSAIPANQKEVLSQLLTRMELAPGQVLWLSGFADRSGNAAYNLQLSQRRVKAVRQLLLSRGYKPVDIVEQYFGSSKARHAEPHENDRKVEIRILNHVKLYNHE